MPDNYIKEQCNYCSGIGEIKGEIKDKIKCPACFGRGYIVKYPKNHEGPQPPSHSPGGCVMMVLILFIIQVIVVGIITF